MAVGRDQLAVAFSVGAAVPRRLSVETMGLGLFLVIFGAFMEKLTPGSDWTDWSWPRPERRWNESGEWVKALTFRVTSMIGVCVFAVGTLAWIV